jgi:hypothetical protein
MKGRQFQTEALICPCCGFVLGEQAYFQTFELKVAQWLNAKVAPPNEPGYDVYQCASFPNRTFQVKFSNAYRYHNPKVNCDPVTWTWVQKRVDPVHPDYFVLFGIDEEKNEHCFLLTREYFLSTAKVDKQGWHYIRGTAKLVSDRKRYRYMPRIWNYVVKSPEHNLLDRVALCEEFTQQKLF